MFYLRDASKASNIRTAARSETKRSRRERKQESTRKPDKSQAIRTAMLTKQHIYIYIYIHIDNAHVTFNIYYYYYYYCYY